jgi:S-adenosylmethionine hydrolase
MRTKNPVVGLLTDFGLQDHYVGVVKAVITSLCPKAIVIDITHGVSPHDVGEGAYLLWASYRYFPAGSVIVGIVDPGVGSNRGIVGARSSNHVFLAPDNGLLELVVYEEGIKHLTAVRLDYPAVQKCLPEKVSSTFHGRDIFAPLAAGLLRGERLENLGLPAQVKETKSPFIGKSSRIEPARVLHIDTFGNVITNIRQDLPSVQRRTLALKIGRRRITKWISHYASLGPDEAGLIIGSSGLVEIVSLQRSAAAALGLRRSSILTIEPGGYQ